MGLFRITMFDVLSYNSYLNSPATNWTAHGGMVHPAMPGDKEAILSIPSAMALWQTGKMGRKSGSGISRDQQAALSLKVNKAAKQPTGMDTAHGSGYWQ
mmetsp:Transcript_1438/g.3244  ORF Transcript_1438/g.3244 Transcript_1438/m.3244 type:complete len:99 (-) Transcript_1438:150-446(-)